MAWLTRRIGRSWLPASTLADVTPVGSPLAATVITACAIGLPGLVATRGDGPAQG